MTVKSRSAQLPRHLTRPAARAKGRTSQAAREEQLRGGPGGLLRLQQIVGNRNVSALMQGRPTALAARIQRIRAYRVQDDDAERKRVEVSATGAVTINKGPINISIGTPDHALYFLALKGAYDIVEFDIDDSFYAALQKALVSQAAKDHPPGAPTYNDPTKPGYKIEIPEGEWLEQLKGNVKNGKVTQGAQFSEREQKAAYDPKAIAVFLKSILDLQDKAATRQALKLVKEYGLEWDANSVTLKTEDEIEWKNFKEKLWEINNNYYDKKLRGL